LYAVRARSSLKRKFSSKITLAADSRFSDGADHVAKNMSPPSGYPAARPRSYYANGNNDWNKDGIHPKSPGSFDQPSTRRLRTVFLFSITPSSLSVVVIFQKSRRHRYPPPRRR